ncbi:MAG: hypothetical protein ACI4SR_05785 [Faecalibacillus sp.]
MKKRWIIITIFVVLLCSCNSKSTSQGQKDTTTKQETGEKIDTNYFTIMIPEKWQDLYEYEIYPDSESHTYAIEFYEKTSRQEINGGYLFGISLYQENENLYDLPSFKLLGNLEVDQDIYQVVVEYPTDVQYTEKAEKNYRNLAQDIDDILDTIQAKDNYSFIKNKS